MYPVGYQIPLPMHKQIKAKRQMSPSELFIFGSFFPYSVVRGSEPSDLKLEVLSFGVLPVSGVTS